MKTKEEIVVNWLPGYTGTPLAEFGSHILLVNFGLFSQITQNPRGQPSQRRQTSYPAKAGNCIIVRPKRA